MPTMSRMKRMHGGAVAEEKYAVAVRDAGGLHLFMWVRVSLRSEFFTMLPRPRDPSINAHASLHADGSYHIKSHGLPRCMERQKQKPDGTLVDTEHLMDQGLNRAGVLSIGENCDPREWNGVFEIPIADLANGPNHTSHVSADLIGRGGKPTLFPEAPAIDQTIFRQNYPLLVFTHYFLPIP